MELPDMKQGTKADDIVVLCSKSPSDDREISPSKEINRAASRTSHCHNDPVWLLVSVVTFAVEIASAVAVSVKYYQSGAVWWFGLTSGFILLASFTMQIFSLRWFFEDGKAKHALVYILHLLQLGPLLRYYNTLKSSWRCRHVRCSSNEYLNFLVEWRDITMLRLFQSFLLSAPQMVLQLYVMTRMHRNFNNTVVLFTATAAGCSTLSLIWTLVTHSKVLREFRRARSSLSFTGFLLQVLWRASMVTSRVVALVLFASHFAKWLLLAVALHWAIMTFWLICQRNTLCTDDRGREHPLREKLFSAVVGFMYIFCFFNIKEGITRKRLVLFYSLMLVENSLLVAMWYPNRTFQGMAVFASLVSVWGGFAFGIMCMIFYYYFYHPSLPVQGMFLRKRTFDVEGRRAYNLVFCCCCQFKTRETTYGDCEQSKDGEVIVRGSHQPRASPPFEMEILPRAASRDLYREVGSSASSRAEILVHSTPRMLGNPRHPLVFNDIPDVVETKASSRACSPAISNSSLVARSDLELEFDNAGHISQPLFCTLPEQFMIIGRDIPTERSEGSLFTAPLNTDEKVEELLNEEKSGDGTNKEVEAEFPRINYGTLSFGHRYSLVSSDCISLSSESSRSSIDSIMFEDEGRPTVRINDGNAPKVALTARTADEGIYSDERCSTGVQKASSHFPAVPDNVTMTSVVQDRSLNSVLSSPEDENLGYLEYLMDAISPLQLRARQQTAESASEKEDGAESESDWHTDASSDTGPVHCSLEEIKRGETGSSTGPRSPSDAVAQKRHTFDFSELSAGSKRWSRKRPARSQRRRFKRKEFDNFVVTYLKPGKFGSLRRSRERLAKIQEDSEDLSVLQGIDVIPEAPCPRLPTPELKTPSDELSRTECSDVTRATPTKPDISSRDITNGDTRNICVEEDRGAIKEEDSDSDKESAPLDQCDIPGDESSSSQSSPINKVDVERVKAEFVKRRRLKRFLSKGFSPGKYSSVRFSYERIPIDELGRESHSGDRQQNHSEGRTAVDVELASLEHHPNSSQTSPKHHDDTRSAASSDNVWRILAGTGRVNEHYKSKRLENGFSGIRREVSNYSSCGDKLLARDEEVNCSHPSQSGSLSSLTASPDKRHTYDFSLLSTEHSKRPDPAINGSAANDSLEPLLTPLGPVWVPQPLASNRRKRRSRSAVLYFK